MGAVRTPVRAASLPGRTGDGNAQEPYGIIRKAENPVKTLTPAQVLRREFINPFRRRTSAGPALSSSSPRTGRDCGGPRGRGPGAGGQRSVVSGPWAGAGGRGGARVWAGR